MKNGNNISVKHGKTEKNINKEKKLLVVQKKEKRKKGNYFLEETIGEGAFAKVKLGKHIITGEKVAVKILNKDKMISGNNKEIESTNDMQKIRKEINILRRLKHKNIIQLYEIMESKSNLYIVMEYCEGKELFDYIVKRKRLTEREACRYFQQIINGVEYLHLSNITHRDLKPENLLLDNKKRILISDFGLSFLSTSHEYLLSTPCGTPSYAPPEMLRGEKYNGVYSDIWSCGVILYTMLVGNLPCSESKEELIYQNIMTHNYYYPDNITDDAIDLIEHMLKIKPEERYNFDEIKAHPWFNILTPKLRPGIVFNVHKIPLDEKILSKVVKLGFDRNKCQESVLNNHYDSLSAVYYLILKQFKKDNIPSVSDLFSNAFLDYLKDYKNWINPSKINEPLFKDYEVVLSDNLEDDEMLWIPENNSSNNIPSMLLQDDDSKDYLSIDSGLKPEDINNKETLLIDNEIKTEQEKEVISIDEKNEEKKKSNSMIKENDNKNEKRQIVLEGKIISNNNDNTNPKNFTKKNTNVFNIKNLKANEKNLSQDKVIKNKKARSKGKNNIKINIKKTNKNKNSSGIKPITKEEVSNKNGSSNNIVNITNNNEGSEVNTKKNINLLIEENKKSSKKNPVFKKGKGVNIATNEISNSEKFNDLTKKKSGNLAYNNLNNEKGSKELSQGSELLNDNISDLNYKHQTKENNNTLNFKEITKFDLSPLKKNNGLNKKNSEILDSKTNKLKDNKGSFLTKQSQNRDRSRGKTPLRYFSKNRANKKGEKMELLAEELTDKRKEEIMRKLEEEDRRFNEEIMMIDKLTMFNSAPLNITNNLINIKINSVNNNTPEIFENNNNSIETLGNINNNTQNINNNKNSNETKNKNMVYQIAERLIKTTIFSKYLIGNKKPKHSLKIDLENKFYILQKYKNIIGLIERMRNKIFTKKVTDFNFYTFDEYLNDENDKMFTQALVKIPGFNDFIQKAKQTAYKKDVIIKKSLSKNYTMKPHKFNISINEGSKTPRYSTSNNLIYGLKNYRDIITAKFQKKYNNTFYQHPFRPTNKLSQNTNPSSSKISSPNSPKNKSIQPLTDLKNTKFSLYKKNSSNYSEQKGIRNFSSLSKDKDRSNRYDEKSKMIRTCHSFNRNIHTKNDAMGTHPTNFNGSYMNDISENDESISSYSGDEKTYKSKERSLLFSMKNKPDERKNKINKINSNIKEKDDNAKGKNKNVKFSMVSKNSTDMKKNKKLKTPKLENKTETYKTEALKKNNFDSITKFNPNENNQNNKLLVIKKSKYSSRNDNNVAGNNCTRGNTNSNIQVQNIIDISSGEIKGNKNSSRKNDKNDVDINLSLLNELYNTTKKKKEQKKKNNVKRVLSQIEIKNDIENTINFNDDVDLLIRDEKNIMNKSQKPEGVPSISIDKMNEINDEKEDNLNKDINNKSSTPRILYGEDSKSDRKSKTNNKVLNHKNSTKHLRNKLKSSNDIRANALVNEYEKCNLDNEKIINRNESKKLLGETNIDLSLSTSKLKNNVIDINKISEMNKTNLNDNLEEIYFKTSESEYQKNNSSLPINLNQHKSKKELDIRKDLGEIIPFDLNCIVILSMNEVTSNTKKFFKKSGFNCNEKGNTLKIIQGNTNIEINFCKLKYLEAKHVYCCARLKNKEQKKDKKLVYNLIKYLNKLKDK